MWADKFINHQEQTISFIDVKTLYDAAYEAKKSNPIDVVTFKRMMAAADSMAHAYRSQLQKIAENRFKPAQASDQMAA